MRILAFSLLLFFRSLVSAQNGIVVFQSDFGQKDGAVAAMKGVCLSVSPRLQLFDLTHEIPAFNIFEASYRLEQTAPYWPAGTVFVSVVDPGVGTERNSVVLKTRSGHFFVTPDNGTLSHVSRSLGIEEIREIDEARNRRQDSKNSYTFHGRDVYAYTAARLASGLINFEQVGPKLTPEVVTIQLPEAKLVSGTLTGSIPVLDVQYGNVWTNIPDTLVSKAGIKTSDKVMVKIHKGKNLVFSGKLELANTFGDVPKDSSLAYFNSLRQLSFAINEGNFAAKWQIGSGEGWGIEVKEIGDRKEEKKED